jgi:transposase, IS30 family
LRKGWSPEQACGWIERQHGCKLISPETIYRFIHDQIARHKDYSWRHYLPRGKSKRGRRGRKGGSSALHIRDRIPIAERPQAIQDRSFPGHWEADLMLFAKYGQAILTLHERSSRLLIATKPPGKAAMPIVNAISRLLEPLPPDLRQSITFDNGTEFARHYELHRLAIATFFCDPYAPWQKGGIENAIGRMRRTIPRKTDLAALSSKRLASLVSAYNNTPRKCLDWKTPAELFCEQLLHFKCESTSWPSQEWR